MSKIYSKIYYRETNEGENIINTISENKSFSLTQSNIYYRWQKSINRKSKRYTFYKKDKESEKVIGYVQFFEYKLFKNYNYYYAPLGPVIFEYHKELIVAINKLCKELNKDKNIIFTRIDIMGVFDNKNIQENETFIKDN